MILKRAFSIPLETTQRRMVFKVLTEDAMPMRRFAAGLATCST